jgi:hypothetical protein
MYEDGPELASSDRTVRKQMPHIQHSRPRRGTDRDPAVDARSEEAFRLVATLYQALVSAESSERSLRDVTNPELVEFFRTVQKQQLGIAQRARSILVDMQHPGDTVPVAHYTRAAG